MSCCSLRSAVGDLPASDSSVITSVPTSWSHLTSRACCSGAGASTWRPYSAAVAGRQKPDASPGGSKGASSAAP
eukprot:8210323-Heterocapsa_arctica.AAC.1